VTSERTRLTFRVLGEFEVLAGGTAIPLGGAKQRMLLGLLLVERGQAVSTDRLIDALWSGAPPATAQKSIQVYVSGLRKALGEDRILTRARGYELVVEPGEVDIEVFDELVRAAMGAPPESAASTLREASQLVRGRPLSDVALEPWAAPEVARIEERILTANELRIESDLELGRHAELVQELETLVDANPYRERLLELLMLALYRSGRQAEALAAYRRGAARARDELGIEPGRPLQQLEASILRQDPAVDGPPRASREPSAAKRRRSAKVAIAGAIAVAAAAAAAAAIALTREDTASLESLPPGVAIISATDGSLVAHVPTSEIAQPVEAVTGNGHFWVANLDPPSTVEIDPATGAIRRRLGSVFPGEPGWSLPDGRNIWFAFGRELVRMNLTESRALDRYPMTTARNRLGLGWVARCSGPLWVADNKENAVLRVDPATGAVRARIRAQYPWAVACGDDAVWITSGGVGVQRIDPATNRIVATARVPYPNVTLAVGGGYAWTSNETNGTVYKVDSHGEVVATYQTGDGARQLSFANGRVWVANQDVGTVTSIDAATGEQRTYGFGHPLQAIAAAGSTLAVIVNPGLTYEDRIDALQGEVARLIVPTYAFDPVDPALAYNPWVFMAERATCATLVSARPGSPRQVIPDLATSMPVVSTDGRTYTFRVRQGVRFAPPSRAIVTPKALRYSIERALSPKLGSDVPGIHFLADVVGAQEFNRGAARHVRGIRVAGDSIALTLAKPSTTFLERLALPFFCTVPLATPVVEGGVTVNAPPSAGPYYMSDGFNGEYAILKRNPNYAGPRPAQLDAIAFREGISPEHAVARVRSGEWDGAILPDDLLAPGGVVAREVAAGSRLRTEELPVRGVAYPGEAGSMHALLSSRLGCDTIAGDVDLASLCIRDH
jgi:DNA-binding SARP family transcriptional activator/streptogramin lyase